MPTPMEKDFYKSVKIVVDPSSRVYYASFYLQGFYDLLGKSNVRFSNQYFVDLERDKIEFSFEHYFAFVAEFGDGTQKKIVVDFCDPPDIHETAYAWSDVYAKINYNRAETPDVFTEKILLIPPSFGIRTWGVFETFLILARNLAKCGFKPIIGFKRFVEDYKLQLRRARLHRYTSRAETIDHYVFMIATLWTDSEAVNRLRKKFIDAVVSSKSKFEGGFFSKRPPGKYASWQPYFFSRPYSAAQYLEKTKRSSFVFNTPAVHGCHGWKLAEYLAMGKAIVSTPLNNEIFPALRDREHIHFIDDVDAIEPAVLHLDRNPEYRFKLERSARDCFMTGMQPRVVVERILGRAMADGKR